MGKTTGLLLFKMAGNILSQFLGTVLIDLPIIFIDIWSFVHLLSGFLIGKYLIKSRKSILVLLVALIGYEIIEMLGYGVIFRPETQIDVLWDIIIGTIGWYFGTKK